MMVVKEWFDSLPAPARWPAFIGAVVVACAVLVLVVSLILGKLDTTSLSNAFFFACAIVFLVAVVWYFAGSQAARPDWRKLAAGKQAEADQKHEEERPRRPEPMPFYPTALFLAGLILFGLSIAVSYL
jgi:type VI protein secretion system component VasK